MLETIREFAWEQVPEPERATIRDRHLAYFVELAERSDAQMRGPDQARWIGRLAADQADIRAALGWAQEARRAESLIRLSAALRRRFWYEAGGSSEGMRWLEAAMEAGSDAPATVHVKAMQRAAWIVWEMGDGERSQDLFRRSLEIADEDDHLGRCEALIGLSYRALGTGGPGLGRRPRRMGQAIEHARLAGTPGALVEPLTAQGHLAKAQGDPAGARSHFEEALEMARLADDVWGAASALLQQGILALGLGEPARAEPLLAESARLATQCGDRELFAHATAALAEALTARGDLGSARSRLREVRRGPAGDGEPLRRHDRCSTRRAGGWRPPRRCDRDRGLVVGGGVPGRPRVAGGVGGDEGPPTEVVGGAGGSRDGPLRSAVGGRFVQGPPRGRRGGDRGGRGGSTCRI